MFGRRRRFLETASRRENHMPYFMVEHENSAPIELYYEDHGEGTPWCCSTTSRIPDASGAIRCRP